MGERAVGADLVPLAVVGERAAALVAQRIQRTVAEQTVEILRVIGRMTGEKFTVTVAEKGIMLSNPTRSIRHRVPPKQTDELVSL